METVTIVQIVTLPVAVVGIVQLIKLLAKDLFNYKIKSSITIVLAIFLGAGVNAFVDLTSALAVGAYAGANAVGFITGLQKLGSVVKFGDPGDEGVPVEEPPVDEKPAV